MRTKPTTGQDYVHHGRDLRLDFLRGIVMLVVVCVHLEYVSLISMLMWERLGLVSSAEGFVSLSGVVLGIVYKKRLLKEGFRVAAIKLWKRAWQLYTVNIAVITSILLLQYIPAINIFSVTHWVSPAGATIYPLFPEAGSSWLTILKQALLLEIGPHQFQIIGLYTVLIAIAPVVLYALSKQKTLWVILLSWSVYLINSWLQYRFTSARFEYGFPTLTWQLLFFNGMIIGFHHKRVFDYLCDSANKRLVYAAAVLLTGFMLLALNNPEPVHWPWHTATYGNAATYKVMYETWFSKSRLGIGRILNNIALYVTLFAFISRYWQYCYKVLGWLVIPIGQASLYVFIWHIYLVLLFSNMPLPAYNNIWINTCIHIASIALIWLMVKKRFLFSIVPR
ncbi:MAG: OpgC domain-containing protein [Methylococcales bacterium]|nr:OpgC domain-containing protein [Methylococcales bacterium]